MLDDSRTPPNDLDLSKVHLLLQAGAKAQARSLSASSLRAYHTDWRQFAGWCADKRVPSLPATPKTVAVFLAEEVEAGRKVATIERRRAAIAFVHEDNGFTSPTRSDDVTSVMSAIRKVCQQPPASRRPLRTDQMLALVETLDRKTLIGARDVAMLTTMWGAALLRSELVALNVADVDWAPGLHIVVRGNHRSAPVPPIPVPSRSDALCPMRAMADWLRMYPIDAGALFPSIDRWGNIRHPRITGRSVAEVVKRAAERAGLDPADYSSSSCRIGFFESAADAGVHDRDIMRHGRIRSPQTVHRFTAAAPIFDATITPSAAL